MAKDEDICSVCSALGTEQVSFGFNRNVEDKGINLCGKHAVEYYNWRVDKSIREPDVERFVLFIAKGVDRGPRSLEDKLSSPGYIKELENEQKLFLFHLKEKHGQICEVQDSTLKGCYESLKCARGLLQRAKVQQELTKNVQEYQAICEKIGMLERNVERHETSIENYIQKLKQKGYTGFVKEARSLMQAGKYNDAIEKYRNAESLEDISDLYKSEIRISLETSIRASELNTLKDNVDKELTEHRKTLYKMESASNRCVSEEQAVKYTIAGLDITKKQIEGRMQELTKMWEENVLNLYGDKNGK